MASADGARRLRVAVACSPRATEAFEVEVELPAPASAWDAVRASGVLERWPELASGEASVGIWGRAACAETALRDGDRVEIYRPLAADPQEARRRRVKEARRKTR
ncbi:MAG TPA: RnfH family protein [Caldimonas sp.]|jgi:putative ubiquitin-RnfH superfamily antitoxin RatB of RatAB toxin-antitoxin module|nr:RnfH family protein [Caldimonas sp.]